MAAGGGSGKKGGASQGPNRDGSAGTGKGQGPNRDGSAGVDTKSKGPGAGTRGPAQGPNRDGSTVDVNPKGAPASKRAPDNTPTTNPLDKLLGYDTIGERRAAYKNNPNRPGGRNLPPVAMVPNFPDATPGIVAGAVIDALGALGPVGAISLGGRIVDNAMNPDQEFSTGLGMDAMKALGASLGAQDGEKGVGVDRSGKGNATGGAGLSSTISGSPGVGTSRTASDAPEGTVVPGLEEIKADGTRYLPLAGKKQLGPRQNRLF